MPLPDHLVQSLGDVSLSVEGVFEGRTRRDGHSELMATVHDVGHKLVEVAFEARIIIDQSPARDRAGLLELSVDTGDRIRVAQMH